MSDRAKLEYEVREAWDKVAIYEKELAEHELEFKALIVKAQSYLNMMSKLVELRLGWHDISAIWDNLLRIFPKEAYSSGIYEVELDRLEKSEEELVYWKNILEETREKLWRLEDE